jgi:hypothetical protein
MSDGDAFEQDGRGRRRNWQFPVGRIDPTVPNRDREVVDRLDGKVFETSQNSYHIEQGI